jgi:hypothetical protein
MEKYNFKITAFYLIAVLFFGIYACTDDSDDWKKYIKGGEIVYTGKIDSVKVFSGKNRVFVQGVITSDPKVSELRVYWNLKQDSVVVPIVITSGIDTVSTYIDDLEENIYNFEFLTFDNQGNKSVSQSVTAEVYGDRYSSSLINRPIVNAVPEGNNLSVNFADMDRSTGVIGSELIYSSTDGSEKNVFIEIDSFSIDFVDYQSATAFNYRTLFVPEETAIDTFYTAFESVIPKPTPVLKNATQPFEPVAGQTGRWRDLAAPWITNAAAKSHAGFGGWDEGCCTGREASMNLECGWGQPPFTNAKIYQVTSADAGKVYQLRVNVITTNYPSGSNYIVVALDDGIPDLNNVTSAPEVLAYHSITADGLKTLEFTLSEISQISVGIVSTQTGDKYCNIKSWEIVEVN